MAQFRILQTAPSVWELDRTAEGEWRVVDKFDSAEAAQTKLAELVAAAAWHRPAPTYFDGKGQAVVTTTVETPSPQASETN
jgi:hypothetical protein